jgi:hypothetical protein
MEEVMHKVAWYSSGPRGGGHRVPYTGTVIGCYYDSYEKRSMLLVADDNSSTIHEVKSSIATVIRQQR